MWTSPSSPLLSILCGLVRCSSTRRLIWSVARFLLFLTNFLLSVSVIDQALGGRMASASRRDRSAKHDFFMAPNLLDQAVLSAGESFFFAGFFSASSGDLPAERMLMNLLRMSNQKGAPREMATA